MFLSNSEKPLHFTICTESFFVHVRSIHQNNYLRRAYHYDFKRYQLLVELLLVETRLSQNVLNSDIEIVEERSLVKIALML